MGQKPIKPSAGAKNKDAMYPINQVSLNKANPLVQIK